MTVDPLHLGPQDTVQVAVMLLRTHGRQVLPVLNEDRIVGIVDAVTLFMYQPDIVVSDIMSTPASVSADLPLSAAAGLMRAHCLSEMPVVDGPSLGVLRSAELLTAWSMPVDPLTRMPWQDSFRLRSSMQLAAGNELTVLFFDMDNFGALNKRYGHIIGDHALQAVARAIRDAMDPATDEACRYGGDEFVVATTRPREEAEAWAQSVRAAIVAIPIEGQAEPLGVSIGVSGGLRQNERPGSYPPATLDDLLNRASQASTMAKNVPGHFGTLDSVRVRPLTDVPAPRAEGPARPARIRIVNVQSDQEEGCLHVTVHLDYRGVTHLGTAHGQIADEPSIVAEATAKAVNPFLPPSYSVQLTHAGEQVVSGSERVMMALVRLDGPHGWQNLVGVADVTASSPRSAVKAVLDALNRPLEALSESPDLTPVL